MKEESEMSKHVSNNKMILLKKLVLLSLTLILSAMFYNKNAEAAEAPMTRVDVHLSLSFTDVKGKQCDIKEFKESVMVLLFGRSGCPNSRAMLQKAEEIRESGKSVRTIFLGVDSVDNGIMNLAKQYPNAVFAKTSSENNNRMWGILKSCGFSSETWNLPACFIVNRDGVIVYYCTGNQTEALDNVILNGDLNRAKGWPVLTTYGYCEFTAPSNIYVYQNTNCTVRGTTYPYKEYNAYIGKGDVCYIYQITSTYLKVSYPASSGRRIGYIPRASVIRAGYPTKIVPSSRAKVTTYRVAGGSYSGYIGVGDRVYLCGTVGDNTAVIYTAVSGNRAYKFAYISTSDAKKIM